MTSEGLKWRMTAFVKGIEEFIWRSVEEAEDAYLEEVEWYGTVECRVPVAVWKELLAL